MRELEVQATLGPERTRRPGGGRKRTVEKDASLAEDLDRLVEPTASGDPDSPLRWTSKSVRHLATELQTMGHAVSYRLVKDLLHAAGYSLQANRKTREGPQHPDRDAQFRYLNDQVQRFQRQHRPTISVDTKKKELVGDFKNAGREWRRKGRPEQVRVHDFLIPERGKAVPYGVYDLARNEGWVSVGIDHDTASFAVDAIRRWWTRMGRGAIPNAGAADHGRCGRQQRPAGPAVEMGTATVGDELGLEITVCHFPPGPASGTRSNIGCSRISRRTGGASRSSSGHDRQPDWGHDHRDGLTVRSEIDRRRYPQGVVITDDQMARLHLEPHAFHGDWNYTIRPATRSH